MPALPREATPGAGNRSNPVAMARLSKLPRTLHTGILTFVSPSRGATATSATGSSMVCSRKRSRRGQGAVAQPRVGLRGRLGKRGRFIGCTGYPECDYTRNLGDEPDKSAEPEVVEGRVCPQCGSPLIIRQGPYGKFIGCSSYPKCKFIESLEQPQDTGVQCPKCHKGTLVKRKSRRGKIFYSCSTYPACDYAVWNEPLNEPCPQCGWPILTLKFTKRKGAEKVCPQEGCGFSEPVEAEAPAEDEEE